MILIEQQMPDADLASRIIADQQLQIDMTRHNVNSWIDDPRCLVMASGACSQQLESAGDMQLNEAVSHQQWARRHHPEILPLSRTCVRKPRSDESSAVPKDWKGLNYSEPELVRRVLARFLRNDVDVCLEVTDLDQLNPESSVFIGDIASFVWLGSRFHDKPLDDKTLLITALSKAMPHAVIGVKTDMSGRSRAALSVAAEIDLIRSQAVDNPGSTIVISRGGTAITTPVQMQELLSEVEQARQSRSGFDPSHGFKKMFNTIAGRDIRSPQGAIEAMSWLLDNSQIVPSLVLVEATDSDAITRRQNPERLTDLGMSIAEARRLTEAFSDKLPAKTQP